MSLNNGLRPDAGTPAPPVPNGPAAAASRCSCLYIRPLKEEDHGEAEIAAISSDQACSVLADLTHGQGTPEEDPPEDEASEEKSARSQPSRQPIIQRYSPLSQVINARNAFLFAEQKGKPLNTFVTINFNRDKRHWERGNRSPEQVAYVRDRRLRALRDWGDHNGVDPFWISAIENPPQGGHGPHIHLLLHLLADRWANLSEALQQSLRDSMGWSQDDLEELRTKVVADPGRHESSRAGEEVWLPFHISRSAKGFGPLDASERLVRLRYICKSMNPMEIVLIDGRSQTVEKHAGPSFNPDITIQDCGDPRTKRRIGTSRNLALKARREFGWIETRDLDWLSRDVERKHKLASVQAMLKRHSLAKQASIRSAAAERVQLQLS